MLIRWMERLDTGQPLIYGDGSQTMDFVYVDDAARATILALASNVSDEVLNVASGVETSLNELAAALSGVMNVRRPSEHALERKVNAVTRRLAATERAERMLGFTASVPRGRSGPPGRMVAHGASARVTAVRTLIPVARPALEREGTRARRAIFRLVSQGPEGAAFRTGVRRGGGGVARLRGVELHDGAAPRPRGRCWTGRRGRHGEPFVHRHGQRDPLLRHAGIR